MSAKIIIIIIIKCKEPHHLPISSNRLKSWKPPSYCAGLRRGLPGDRQQAFWVSLSTRWFLEAFVFGLTMAEITWTIWRGCVCTYEEGGVFCRQRGCRDMAEARVEAKGENSISQRLVRGGAWGREEASTSPECIHYSNLGLGRGWVGARLLVLNSSLTPALEVVWS